MHHGDDDVLGGGDEVHRAAHSFYELAGDFPVGDVSVLGYLHGAEYGKLDVLPPDHGEAGGGVEDGRAGLGGDGLLAGVDHVGVLLSGERKGAHAKDAVFRLELDADTFRDVVRDQGGDADAEVDVPAVLEFLGYSLGYLVAV